MQFTALRAGPCSWNVLKNNGSVPRSCRAEDLRSSALISCHAGIWNNPLPDALRAWRGRLRLPQKKHCVLSFLRADALRVLREDEPPWRSLSCGSALRLVVYLLTKSVAERSLSRCVNPRPLPLPLLCSVLRSSLPACSAFSSALLSSSSGPLILLLRLGKKHVVLC